MITSTQNKKIPAGYKQTEVGVIPEDWGTCSLKQITLDMLQGVNTAIDKPEYVQDGIPMLKANNVIDGEVVFEGADHISRKTFSGYSDRFKAKKNDFLFSNIGARLGTGSLLKLNVECSFAWNVMRIVPDTQKITPEYLCFLINSPKYSQDIKSKQSGSGMGFVPKGVRDLVFALPKRLEEQTTIAAVLADTDALIKSLEKLIAKKRAVKQGVMQELLTGKSRLSGFSGEWGYIRLESIAQRKDYSIVDGPFGSQMKVNEFVGEGIPVIEMEHLEDKQSLGTVSRYITKQKFEVIKRSAIYPGDIVISKTGTLGILGVVPVSIPKGIITSRLAKISVDQTKADVSLVFHWLRKLKMDGYWEKVSQGGTMQILGIRMLKETPFPHVGLPEQAAIASVLSDMDAEIDALEQRLAKYKQLKQGIMQVLLTGKIRLRH